MTTRRDLCVLAAILIVLGLSLSVTGWAEGGLLSPFTPIDYPNSTLTEANGISNTGLIVGDYNDASGRQHGFQLSGGVYTSIEPPGAFDSSANGANSSGQIVGFYRD